MSGSNSSAPDAALAEPVSFTVHSVAAPDVAAADPRRTRHGRLKMLLVLAVCAAPVVASYFTYFVLRPQGRSNYGALIEPARPMPPLPLLAGDGRAVDAATLRGQWLLVAVGPPDCSGPCERRLFMQRQLREMLGRERERVDKVWFVTGGAALPALRSAAEAAPGMHVLQADRDALARWLEPAAGHALEDHLYVVDPMGMWMMRMPAEAEPAKVKRDLDRLLRASAGWDRAGR
jgi:hypothetical protein